MEAIFFNVSPEVYLQRNKGRTRQVPEDVMQRMAAALEPPTRDEGFDRIIEIGADGTEINRTDDPGEGRQR
jgi:predicted kinase